LSTEIDFSNKLHNCGLRIPNLTNQFLEQAVADTQNNKSDIFLTGSAIIACLDNGKTFRDTKADVKRKKDFERNIKTISNSSHLLVELNLLEDAGVTQEEINHTFSLFDKVANYINANKKEQKTGAGDP
jgi:hypothetical protein